MYGIIHESECARHNMPAMPKADCNCYLSKLTGAEFDAVKAIVAKWDYATEAAIEAYLLGRDAERFFECGESLPYGKRELRKLPPPSIQCVCAFTDWFGMPIDADMDIQTQVAWENWQIAWNASLDAAASEQVGPEVADERKDFEDVVQSHGRSIDRTDRGEYRSAMTDYAWLIWQARASIDAAGEVETLRSNIVRRLQSASDSAYCEYIRTLQRTECLGWEAKVKSGQFGEQELKAHNMANEYLGEHRAYLKAVSVVDGAIALTKEAEPKAAQVQVVPEDWREIMTKLLHCAESQICQHEETHRGGVIWEICDQCSAKWADDEGGKPEFKWPDAIAAAQSFLSAAPALHTAPADTSADEAMSDTPAMPELLIKSLKNTIVIVRRHFGLPDVSPNGGGDLLYALNASAAHQQQTKEL